jgi:hypothetical protein
MMLARQVEVLIRILVIISDLVLLLHWPALTHGLKVDQQRRICAYARLSNDSPVLVVREPLILVHQHLEQSVIPQISSPCRKSS